MGKANFTEDFMLPAKLILQSALPGSGPLGNGGGGLIGAVTKGLTSGGGGGSIGLYDTGGCTGDGGKKDPAGVVHRGEYVFDKQATSRIGVRNLEAIRRGVKGYAAGGPVGGATPGLTLPRIAPAPLSSTTNTGRP